MSLIWNTQNTPSELHSILRTLGEEYPVREGSQGVNLSFEKVPERVTLRVDRRGELFVVTYGDFTFAARGVAYALAGQECDENVCFRSHGILLDCSRSFVLQSDYFKRWLRRLALRCALAGRFLATNPYRRNPRHRLILGFSCIRFSIVDGSKVFV